jgi:hypothetical protein
MCSPIFVCAAKEISICLLVVNLLHCGIRNYEFDANNLGSAQPSGQLDIRVFTLGPNRTFASTPHAATLLSQCGHSLLCSKLITLNGNSGDKATLCEIGSNARF